MLGSHPICDVQALLVKAALPLYTNFFVHFYTNFLGQQDFSLHLKSLLTLPTKCQERCLLTLYKAPPLSMVAHCRAYAHTYTFPGGWQPRRILSLLPTTAIQQGSGATPCSTCTKTEQNTYTVQYNSICKYIHV